MLEYLEGLFFENWGKLLGLCAFLVFIPTYLRARYLWRKRRFLSRINYSINFIEDGTLKFRTLRESNLIDAMLQNVHAVRVVSNTPRFAKPSAFLLFKDKEEAWTILSILLNEI